ncbi:unnamed protein product [Notodromas monacha]|uniref:Uncharacterized protein n=1 Tax=Notodromas monacha TaxID=399045 RepID=A0A7R9GAZ3_9CRUS|nr:unnamed protein product [Notodromas monacha]CAG0915975.1 unnamed protein product [Notodromas monacha]
MSDENRTSMVYYGSLEVHLRDWENLRKSLDRDIGTEPTFEAKEGSSKISVSCFPQIMPGMVPNISGSLCIRECETVLIGSFKNLSMQGMELLKEWVLNLLNREYWISPWFQHARTLSQVDYDDESRSVVKISAEVSEEIHRQLEECNNAELDEATGRTPFLALCAQPSDDFLDIADQRFKFFSDLGAEIKCNKKSAMIATLLLDPKVNVLRKDNLEYSCLHLVLYNSSSEEDAWPVVILLLEAIEHFAGGKTNQYFEILQHTHIYDETAADIAIGKKYHGIFMTLVLAGAFVAFNPIVASDEEESITKNKNDRIPGANEREIDSREVLLFATHVLKDDFDCGFVFKHLVLRVPFEHLTAVSETGLTAIELLSWKQVFDRNPNSFAKTAGEILFIPASENRRKIAQDVVKTAIEFRQIYYADRVPENIRDLIFPESRWKDGVSSINHTCLDKMTIDIHPEENDEKISSLVRKWEELRNSGDSTEKSELIDEIHRMSSVFHCFDDMNAMHLKNAMEIATEKEIQCLRKKWNVMTYKVNPFPTSTVCYISENISSISPRLVTTVLALGCRTLDREEELTLPRNPKLAQLFQKCRLLWGKQGRRALSQGDTDSISSWIRTNSRIAFDVPVLEEKPLFQAVMDPGYSFFYMRKLVLQGLMLAEPQRFEREFRKLTFDQMVEIDDDEVAQMFLFRCIRQSISSMEICIPVRRVGQLLDSRPIIVLSTIEDSDGKKLMPDLGTSWFQHSLQERDPRQLPPVLDTSSSFSEALKKAELLTKVTDKKEADLSGAVLLWESVEFIKGNPEFMRTTVLPHLAMANWCDHNWTKVFRKKHNSFLCMFGLYILLGSIYAWFYSAGLEEHYTHVAFKKQQERQNSSEGTSGPKEKRSEETFVMGAVFWASYSLLLLLSLIFLGWEWGQKLKFGPSMYWQHVENWFDLSTTVVFFICGIPLGTWSPILARAQMNILPFFPALGSLAFMKACGPRGRGITAMMFVESLARLKGHYLFLVPLFGFMMAFWIIREIYKRTLPGFVAALLDILAFSVANIEVGDFTGGSDEPTGSPGGNFPWKDDLSISGPIIGIMAALTLHVIISNLFVGIAINVSQELEKTADGLRNERRLLFMHTVTDFYSLMHQKKPVSGTNEEHNPNDLEDQLWKEGSAMRDTNRNVNILHEETKKVIGFISQLRDENEKCRKKTIELEGQLKLIHNNMMDLQASVREKFSQILEKLNDQKMTAVLVDSADLKPAQLEGEK